MNETTPIPTHDLGTTERLHLLVAHGLMPYAAFQNHKAEGFKHVGVREMVLFHDLMFKLMKVGFLRLAGKVYEPRPTPEPDMEILHWFRDTGRLRT